MLKISLLAQVPSEDSVLSQASRKPSHRRTTNAGVPQVEIKTKELKIAPESNSWGSLDVSV